MRSLLIVLCSLSMAAMEQDIVCDYQGVAPTSLPHPCKHRIEPAVLQDHIKLTGIKRRAEACGIEPRKKIKHQQINTIGVKRAATNELGGPRKKQKLSHIGMLPWHVQKLKAAHAYIIIKENKPIAYLKNLENRYELLRLLGATLPEQTLMVPIHVESLKRSCLVKNARDNNDYSIVSPYAIKKITHLPADFVSNLQEGVPFDVYLHTTGLRRCINSCAQVTIFHKNYS